MSHAILVIVKIYVISIFNNRKTFIVLLAIILNHCHKTVTNYEQRKTYSTPSTSMEPELDCITGFIDTGQITTCPVPFCRGFWQRDTAVANRNERSLVSGSVRTRFI